MWDSRTRQILPIGAFVANATIPAETTLHLTLAEACELAKARGDAVSQDREAVENVSLLRQ
jgi:hypothetical protein